MKFKQFLNAAKNNFAMMLSEGHFHDKSKKKSITFAAKYSVIT